MTPRYEFVLHGSLGGGSVAALSGLDRVVDGEFVVFSGALPAGLDLADVLRELASLGIGLHAVRALPAAGATHS